MILAIMQARMSSTRLPGKVLRPLAGSPMILRQIERVKRAKRIDRLVVATSIDPTDNVLADILEHHGVHAIRGPLDDVLTRFVGVMNGFEDVDHVVRLTADCPLTDPTVIDAVIAHHVESGADYTSNTLGARTYPKGLDVEAMTAETLRMAATEAEAADEREHVTMHIYRHPERFRLEGVVQDADEGGVRWTVDTPDDHAFVSAVYDGVYLENPEFTSDDVRAFVRGRTDLHQFGGDRRI
ncbi:MAG: cytidylyltransferase domain-containing protein [Caulobacteraceae bacterium]